MTPYRYRSLFSDVVTCYPISNHMKICIQTSAQGFPSESGCSMKLNFKHGTCRSTPIPESDRAFRSRTPIIIALKASSRLVWKRVLSYCLSDAGHTSGLMRVKGSCAACQYLGSVFMALSPSDVHSCMLYRGLIQELNLTCHLRNIQSRSLSPWFTVGI
jgi:hypothetical protein